MNDTDNSGPSYEPGPLYEAAHAAEIESADRENPIPGGEPPCPVCGAKTARLVEDHQGPPTTGSSFRVRIVCTSEECRRWTVYNW
jgi:hypothetical protein